jgi:hypothetical protein
VTFDPAIYAIIRAGAIASAERVVPLVRSYVQPETVIDVGGGEGWWAREFAKAGAQTIVLDESVGDVVHFEQFDHESGGGRVDFFPADLTALHRSLVPDVMDRAPYDLALCLEAAEHLPASAAAKLVDFLCDLAPVILFSAAIPGQGGHGHLNEQWPGYWADLFLGRGLVCTEELRWEFWDDPRVEPWYAQNLLIFAKYDWFDAKRLSFTKYPKRLIHPTTWCYYRGCA